MSQFSGTPPPVPWYSHPRQSLRKHLFGSIEQLNKPSSEPLPPRMLVNGVYFPNWKIYKNEAPSSMQLNIVSHAFYAFGWVRPEGVVHLSDDWADDKIEVDGTLGCLRSFQQLKIQHPHLKVIFSVGGGGKGSEPFAAVAADPDAREQFGRSARELVMQYGLDGIDIDWEHPSDNIQGNNYILLLETIRRYLPEPYLLTSALPAGEWALQHIPLSKACQYLDFINLMTYDFSGPWVPASGHHAQLYSPRRPHCDAASLSCDSSVKYLIRRGVPSHKIILGIPAYGRSFLGAGDVGQLYNGHAGEDGTFEYRDLPRPGANEYVDMKLGAAYCCGGDGGFVTYDNAQTVTMKAAFAKEQQLGGVFFWTGTADVKGSRSLIEASFSALHTD
ncbi:glycoside hydrolase [Geopyxis carbonaria]|nr:glycoside hydrolase [Geopyxis carbonaria]